MRDRGAAALDDVADVAERQREPAAHDVNQFLGALRMRLRLVSLAGPQLPRPQFEHVGTGGSDEKRGRAAFRSAPEQPRRAGRQHFRGLLSRDLHEIGD